MRILGIDPGVATIGFGVIDAQRQNNTLIRYGVISTPAGLPLSHRLSQIYADMQELVRTFQPDEMAVEELFFNTNLTTAHAGKAGCRRLWQGGEKTGHAHDPTPAENGQDPPP